MIRILWTVIFLVGFFMPRAQEKSCQFMISGEVKDHHNGEALPFATIYVEELQRGAVSDSAGMFEIGGICAGEYTIVCRHLGCEDIVKKRVVTQDIQLHFAPEHHTEWLQEVAIVGHQEHEERTIRVEQFLSKKQREESIGNSIAKISEKLAGVSIASSGSNVAKPTIHGLHSNRLLIVQNGIRLEGQQWGGDHAPEIDPLLFDKVVAIKGAQGVRYGSDAIAGVLVLDADTIPASRTISGQIRSAYFSNGKQYLLGGQLQGAALKSKKLRWRVNANSNRSGNVSSPEYYQMNTGFNNQSIAWQALWADEKLPTRILYHRLEQDLGVLAGAHIGNKTDLQDAIDRNRPLEDGMFSYAIERPRQHVVHELTGVEGGVKMGDGSMLEYRVNRQYNLRQEFDVHNVNRGMVPELHLELTTHSGEVLLKTERTHNGSFGVFWQQQRNTLEGRLFIPPFLSQSWGVFGFQNWNVGDHKHVELGVRWDTKQAHYFLSKETSAQRRFSEPSVNAGFYTAIGERAEMRFVAASGWRAPSANELFADGVHHGAASFEKGDANLKAERVFSFTQGMTWHTTRFDFQSELFYYHFPNFIALTPELKPVLTIRGAFPAFSYQGIPVQMAGVDFSAQTEWGKNWNSIYQMAYLWSENKRTGEGVFGMPPFNFSWELERVLSMKENPQFATLGVNFNWVAQQKRTPTTDIAPPPPGYFIIGFTGSLKIPVKQQTIRVVLTLDNALNKTYWSYTDRFRYFSAAPGRSVNIRVLIPINQ